MSGSKTLCLTFEAAVADARSTFRIESHCCLLAVCRRWRLAAQNPLHEKMVKDRDIARTINEAAPGDTVVVPAGFYQVGSIRSAR